MSVIIDDSMVAFSASNQKGGFAYFESTGTSSIEVKNKGLINTAISMNDMGGIAYMGGTDNILKIGDAAQVTDCSAKKGAGCFYMGGTTLNKVLMEGGINGDAII
jgi:hypothetical protein